jgi:putative salt-induced outer membrane protein YdiY
MSRITPFYNIPGGHPPVTKTIVSGTGRDSNLSTRELQHGQVKFGLFAGLAIIVLLLLSPIAAEADVVVLKNGDRITGRIIKMESKRLEIDPGYADIMRIKWEDVRSIVSERPMSIKLFGEADMSRDIGEKNADRIFLHTLSEEGPIRLQDVRAINLTEQDYRGYIGAGGNQSSGNTQTQAMNISGSLTYRKREHRFIFDGKYNRAQANQQDTANNGAISVKYDHFLASRVFVGGFDLVEADQFQNLTVRNTSGVVLGYDFLDREHHILSISPGPAMVYQDFDTEAPTITPSLAWILRYQFMFKGDDVVFYHKEMVFKDLGHGSATRVNADQGVKVSIIGNWSLNFEYDLRYNSLPVSGRKTLDTNIIFGINYDIKP